MKLTNCNFACDRKGCTEQSPVGDNFTEARKLALATGWVIHPASGDSRHIGPNCVEAMLATLGEQS